MSTTSHDYTVKDRIKEFMTTAEAARFLGYSQEYVRDLCLAWERTGGRYGIPCTRMKTPKGQGHFRVQKTVLAQMKGSA